MQIDSNECVTDFTILVKKTANCLYQNEIAFTFLSVDLTVLIIICSAINMR